MAYSSSPCSRDFEDVPTALLRAIDGAAETMNTGTDYNQIATKLNYAALDKKLDQLRSQPPPKTRMGFADVLATIADRLGELRAKGWSYPQLAKELREAGLPVKVSALRAHLSSKAANTNKRPPAI